MIGSKSHRCRPPQPRLRQSIGALPAEPAANPRRVARGVGDPAAGGSGGAGQPGAGGERLGRSRALAPNRQASHRTFYSASELMSMHRIDTSKLRRGDLILSTDRSSPISYCIRLATRSPFSHVALCTAPPFVVEAIGVGVARLTLERVLVKDRRNVAVLRPVDDCGTSLPAVCRFAVSCHCPSSQV